MANWSTQKVNNSFVLSKACFLSGVSVDWLLHGEGEFHPEEPAPSGPAMVRECVYPLAMPARDGELLTVDKAMKYLADEFGVSLVELKNVVYRWLMDQNGGGA